MYHENHLQKLMEGLIMVLWHMNIHMESQQDFPAVRQIPVA